MDTLLDLTNRRLKYYDIFRLVKASLTDNIRTIRHNTISQERNSLSRTSNVNDDSSLPKEAIWWMSVLVMLNRVLAPRESDKGVHVAVEVIVDLAGHQGG